MRIHAQPTSTHLGPEPEGKSKSWGSQPWLQKAQTFPVVMGWSLREPKDKECWGDDVGTRSQEPEQEYKYSQRRLMGLRVLTTTIFPKKVKHGHCKRENVYADLG